MDGSRWRPSLFNCFLLIVNSEFRSSEPIIGDVVAFLITELRGVREFSLVASGSSDISERSINGQEGEREREILLEKGKVESTSGRLGDKHFFFHIEYRTIFFFVFRAMRIVLSIDFGGRF